MAARQRGREVRCRVARPSGKAERGAPEMVVSKVGGLLQSSRESRFACMHVHICPKAARRSTAESSRESRWQDGYVYVCMCVHICVAGSLPGEPGTAARRQWWGALGERGSAGGQAQAQAYTYFMKLNNCRTRSSEDMRRTGREGKADPYFTAGTRQTAHYGSAVRRPHAHYVTSCSTRTPGHKPFVRVQSLYIESLVRKSDRPL